MKTITIAVIAVALAACSTEHTAAVSVTSANVPTTSSLTPAGVTDQTTLEAQPTQSVDGTIDDQITNSIYAGMLGDVRLAPSAQEVDIASNSGNVTLTGRVRTERERSAIELKAENTSGVRSVENHIEVHP